MRVALVIIKNEKGEILFLLRAKKPFGWALPGGKANDGEPIIDALIREVLEETGISLNPDDIHFLKTTNSVTGQEVEIYMVQLTEKPNVTINKKEHLNKKWIIDTTGYVLAGNTDFFIGKLY